MSEWKEVKVSSICSAQNGYAFKSREFNREGNRYVIKIKELKNGQVVLTADTDKIQYKEEYQKFEIHQGDILFALTGDPTNKPNPLSWVGRVSKYNNLEVSLLNQRVCKIVFSDKIDKDYFYYYFRVFKNFRELASKARGSASQANISTDDILDSTILLPPIPVQKQIASTLSFLDKKIDVNSQIRKNIEHQAQTLFKYFFVDLIPWGGIVPDSWKIGVLGDYLKESREKVGQREGVEEYSIGNNGIRKRSEIYNKSITSTPEKNKLLTQGCLAFGLGNKMITWGVMQDLIGSTSPAYTVYNVDPVVPTDYLLRFFAYYHASAKDLVKPTVRQGQALDKEVLLNKYFVLPSEDAWNSFYNQYNNYLGLFTTLKKQSIQLSQIRDALLPKLMSGQIKVYSD